MNTDELNATLARLRATYPGDWDAGRQAVWSETLEPLSFSAATQAIRTMAADTEFPTIAAFTKAVKGSADGGVITRNGCTFLPGTGWTPCHPDDVDEIPRSEQVADLPELTAPPMSEAEAKRRMAEMRDHIARGRRAMEGDPEVAGKVDALAAALRMADDA